MSNYAKPLRGLALVMVVLAASCSGESASNSAVTPAPTQETAANPTAPAQPGGMPSNANGEAVVARVNGAEITLSEFERAFVRSQQTMFAADDAALRASVLDILIQQELIEQEAARQQIAISDEQLENEYQALRSQAPSEEGWQQWLAENQYTDEEFRASLRPSLITARMRDQVVQALPAQITQVRARHILVDSEAQANDLLTRLANGEDFAALAASFSRDVTTREIGGDLGWFADGELMEPALTQVAFAIQAGQIAGPVATRLGYHVLQVLERADTPVPAEKQPLLAQIAFEKWLQGLAFNAVIERYLP